MGNDSSIGAQMGGVKGQMTRAAGGSSWAEGNRAADGAAWVTDRQQHRLDSRDSRWHWLSRGHRQ
jgi:hypothetical protein